MSTYGKMPDKPILIGSWKYFFLCLMGIVFFAGNALGQDLVDKDLYKSLGIIEPREKNIAPYFNLPDIIDNNMVSLNQFEGKVIILNFWATSCGPCRKEMPSFERLWKKYKDRGLVIIAVTANKGTAKSRRKFIEKHKLTFPVLFDANSRVLTTYEVFFLPITYIIGKDGRFVGKVIGDRKWDDPEFHKLVEGLLSTKGR